MRSLVLTGLICLFYLPSAQAAWDFNINDHSVRGTYSQSTSKSGKAKTDLGLLYVENQANNSTIALHTGLYLGNERLRIGGRLLFTNPDAGDALALGLGGQGRLWIGRKLSFAGHVYYAPDITSTLDASRYREIAVRLAYRITRSDDIYIGFRSLEVTIGDPGQKVEIEEGLHLGFDLHF